MRWIETRETVGEEGRRELQGIYVLGLQAERIVQCPRPDGDRERYGPCE